MRLTFINGFCLPEGTSALSDVGRHLIEASRTSFDTQLGSQNRQEAYVSVTPTELTIRDVSWHSGFQVPVTNRQVVLLGSGLGYQPPTDTAAAVFQGTVTSIRIVDTNDSTKYAEIILPRATDMTDIINAISNHAFDGDAMDAALRELFLDDPVQVYGAFYIDFFGCPEADLMIGYDADDSLVGMEGDDILRGEGGPDTLLGGPGEDLLSGGPGNDLLNGGDGPDLFRDPLAHLDGDTIRDVRPGDGILFPEHNQIPTGLGIAPSPPGQLVIDNNGALTTIQIPGAPAGLMPTIRDVNGQIGIFFTETPVEIDGLPDPDSLLGTAGDDTLRGNDGDDFIDGRGGLDVILGGGGNDEIIGGPSRFPFLDGNNDISGGDGNDTITGGAGTERLAGDGGNDEIRGGLGDDTLLGGAGDDLLTGGDGQNVLNGGVGNDIIIGGLTMMDLRDVVFAGEGNDSVDGGYGNDSLRGDAGEDTIEGGFGVDTLIGAQGNDVLSGSAWSDLIFGGDGDDFINGGFGFDRNNGGPGADRFFHLGVAGHGTDWIQDLSALQGDLLFYGGGAGAATPDDFLIQSANTPGAGDAGIDEVFVTFIPTGTILWALVDGGAQTSINLQIGGQVFDLLE